MTTAASHDDWIHQTAALRRLARALVGSGPDAEDLVQDALLAGWQRGDRTPSPGWLRSVVRSRAIDRSRRIGRRGGEAQVGLEAESADDPSQRPESVVEHLEVQQELLRAMQGLSADYRDAIYLRYFEGLGPSEIAARKEVPVKTVKSRLSRGLALLQERLGEKEQWQRSLALFAAGIPLKTAPASLTLGGFAAALVSMKLLLASVAVLLAFLASWWLFDRGVGTPELSGGATVALDQGAMGGAAPKGAEAVIEVASAQGRERVSTSVADPSGESVSAPAPGEGLAPSSPRPAGALRVHVTWDDGVDAEGVTLIASHLEGPAGHQASHMSVTDARGIARLAGLEPGKHRVRTDRGGRFGTKEVVVVEGGSEESLSISLERGVDVVGVVWQASGAPVQGASIWATSMTPGWTGGRVVAQTDSAGGFRLRDVPSSASIGAIAEGWAPSALIDLDVTPVVDGHAEMALFLERPGGALHGRVEDSEGQPVAGAIVVATRGTAPYRRRSNFTGEETWTPRFERTGQDGTFLMEGLDPGLFEVYVRWGGVPRWTGEATVLAEGTAEVHVVLKTLASVRGQVVGVDGRPVAGATVRVEAPEPRTLAGGPGGSPFAQPWAQTDSDGRYQLDQVAPGSVSLRAEIPDSPKSARTELFLAPGTTGYWDPTLDPGGVIAGTLLYADRTPVDTTYVVATEVGGSKELEAHVSGGAFRFEGLRGVAYDLELQSMEPTLSGTEFRLTGVKPVRGSSGTDLEWILDAQPPVPRKHYVVRFTFDDRGERAPDGAPLGVMLQVPASGASYLGRRDGDADSNRWLVNMQRPATVTPLVVLGGRVIASGESVDLEGTEDVDLGTLRSVPGADVELEIVRPPALEEARVQLEIVVADSAKPEVVDLGSTSATELKGLEPGKIVLRLSGSEFPSVERTIQVGEGAKGKVTVELEAF